MTGIDEETRILVEKITSMSDELSKETNNGKGTWAQTWVTDIDILEDLKKNGMIIDYKQFTKEEWDNLYEQN